MATPRSALTPDIHAFEPSVETTTLDQIIAQNPALAGMRYASGVNDGNNQAAYINALTSAQGNQLALNKQDMIAKLSGDAVNAGPNYVKAGAPDFLRQILQRTAGLDLGQTSLDAILAGGAVRADTASQALEHQANAIHTTTEGGYTPVNAQGGLNTNLTMPDSLRPYVNPSDQAKITAADKPAGGPPITVTKTDNNVSTSAKGGTPEEAMRRLNGVSDAVHGAGDPVRGNPVSGGIKLTAAQAPKVQTIVTVAKQRGDQVSAPVIDKQGNVSLKAGAMTYTFDTTGNRIK